MRLLPILAAASLCALAGCSTIQTLSGTKVPAKTIVVAANTFDGLKATAKNYIAYCTPQPQPASCDDAAIRTKLIPAIKAGTTARNSLEDFMAAHPGELGDSGLVDALTAASSTIQSIVANYKG